MSPFFPRFTLTAALAVSVLSSCAPQLIPPEALPMKVKDGYAMNNGVKIHYVTLGQGPLVVLIHGHPDFWYGWRNQISALAQKYTVVAIDQRGINLSDQPQGSENYRIQNLVGDVAAVIAAQGQQKAIIVGHDTGAAVAWAFATALPQMTDKLITLSLPHPQALAREIATNPDQQKASALSLSLAQPGSESKITREQLLGVVNPQNEVDKSRYAEAFGRTRLDAFVGYFQANLGGPPPGTPPAVVPVNAPVLAIHGAKDPFVLTGGYEFTKQFAPNGFKYVLLPNAGHFPQVEAADEVTKTMLDWLRGGSQD